MSEQIDSIFYSWFVKLEPFDGNAPSNWNTKKFSEFLTLLSEKSTDISIPMYSVTDTGIYPRDEKFNKNLSMSGGAFKVARKNNLVFGMSRAILNWGILHEDIAGVSAAYTVYNVDDSINSVYLEYYIKHHEVYFKDIIRLASREVQGIDRTALFNKEILLPDDNWMNKFLDAYKKLKSGIDNAKEENSRLSELRDSLLPKLMSGELDVSDLEI